MSAASCCGFSPRIPQLLRRETVRRAARRGSRLGTVHPHLAAAYPNAVVREVRRRRARRDRSRVRGACRMATARRSRPTILDNGIPFVDLGADFRLGRCGDLRALVRPCAPGARAAWRVRLRHSRAQPRGDPRRKGGRRGGLLCDRRDPRAQASGRRRAGRSRKPDRRCGLGRQRRRPRGEGSDRLQHGRRKLCRLRAAQPPPHGRNGNGARRDRAVHAPSRPDDARHSRDLLRRGDRRRAIRSRRCRRLMPTSRSSTSPTSRPRPSGSAARTASSSPRATTSGPAACSRSSAIDNLGKGAAGQMIQCANLMLGLEETAGLTTIGVYP